MVPLDSISLSNDITQFHCIFAVTIFQNFRLQNPYISVNLRTRFHCISARRASDRVEPAGRGRGRGGERRRREAQLGRPVTTSSRLGGDAASGDDGRAEGAARLRAEDSGHTKQGGI
jgi:hypothetical protein